MTPGLSPRQLRKTRVHAPYPLIEGIAPLTLDSWLRFFCSAWLILLLFTTRNPIMNALTLSAREVAHPRGSTFTILVGGGLLFAMLIGTSAWWACGPNRLRQLWPHWRWRDTGIIALFTLLYLVVTAGAGALADTVTPLRGTLILTNTVEYAQLSSWPLLWTMTIRSFFQTIGFQLLAVFIYLAILGIMRRFAPRYPHVTDWVALVAAAALAGMSQTSPLAPQLGHNLLAFGLPQIVALAAYRQSRHIAAPIMVVFNLRLVVLLFGLIGL